MKKPIKKLRATVTFNKEAAKRLTDMRYYTAMAKDRKQYAFISYEKTRLSTLNWDKISELIETYKTLAETEESSLGKALKGIYDKQSHQLSQKLPPKRINNILSILAKPETLLLAYRQIRGNTGAMSKGQYKTKEDINNMTPEQRQVYWEANHFPDGFGMRHILQVSKLIRLNMYPWGTSRRIYFDKPGDPSKKRPITIPPFLDRVVQKAICMVLEAIYEPVFETMNCSFGFRPNKGVHNAIVAITSYDTNGLFTAIEGDIQAAFDEVQKKRLIEGLSKYISDKKFLSFMTQRLAYDFVEKDEKGKEKRIEPALGIPPFFLREVLIAPCFSIFTCWN